MPNIQRAQHAYTLCDGTQDPVTTIAGNSGSARFRKLCMATLDQDVYDIEIEKRLERHVGENDEGKKTELDARLSAQEFEVQVREIGTWTVPLWRHASGHRLSTRTTTSTGGKVFESCTLTMRAERDAGSRPPEKVGTGASVVDGPCWHWSLLVSTELNTIAVPSKWEVHAGVGGGAALESGGVAVTQGGL